MATHSSTLAWKIPWAEEPGRLQSMGSLRVGQDWATSLSLSLSSIGEGNGNPLQCSCLENPRGRGAWWAAIYGVAQSRTWLKQFSSSSSSLFLDLQIIGWWYWVLFGDIKHFERYCRVTPPIGKTPEESSGKTGKILAQFRPRVVLLGEVHWLKPTTLDRHPSNHLHELFYDRRSW